MRLFWQERIRAALIISCGCGDEQAHQSKRQVDVRGQRLTRTTFLDRVESIVLVENGKRDAGIAKH